MQITAILLTMVRAENVGKRYGPRWLFRHLEFDLSPGDCLVITGANGAGKSSLLKCLAGLAPLSEGKVSRSRLGYVSLDLQLYPWLTAREHLEFIADMNECPANEDLLNRVGLPEAARGQYAGKFSTGMRARLRLAMALLPKPDVLLLDEPGASLDEAGRQLIATVVADQQTRGVVILATNDPLEEGFATHGLCLA